MPHDPNPPLYFVWLLALGFLLPAAQAATPTPAPAKPVEQKADLAEIIQKGLGSGLAKIVIPPGRYRVTPRGRSHLSFKDLRDVTIIADGVEMVCTQTTRAITVENCENLSIRGLTIDYDPLPFTQARIVAMTDDNNELDVAVIPGYPAPNNGPTSVEIFDPATNQLRGRTTFYNMTCATTGPATATISKNNPARSAQPMGKLGDIVVLSTSNTPESIPHAIAASDSDKLTFENITLYAGVTFGFYEQNCNASKYLGCRIDRRPPANDLVARGYPRLRSQNADGFQSKNARQGPLYERCTAYYTGDDSIAINGDFHYVISSTGPLLRVIAKHQMTMQTGDNVQLFGYNGVRTENRKIITITPDGKTTDNEREEISKHRNLNPNLPKVGLTKAYNIKLDAPVTVPAGTLICSADAIGTGFIIRDCKVGHNRSRGIIIKAGGGLITGNQIEGSVMSSILVSPEFYWMEGGLSDDLKIIGNTISNGRGMGIAVVAVGGDGQLAQAGAFRNLTVRDNTVKGGASPGLLITSVRGLNAANNNVQVTPGLSLSDWEMGGWNKYETTPTMLLNNE